MSSFTLKQSIKSFPSESTLGILPNGSSSSFFVAYTNSDSDNNLAVQQMVGDLTNGYTLTSLHAPGKATMSPAMVNYKGDIYLFYRENSSDTSHDKSFYYIKYSNGTWSSPVNVSDQGVKGSSDHNPVIYVYNNQIWLLDKNNSHHFIAEAWMDRNGNGTEIWSTNSNETYWNSDDDDAHLDWGYQTGGSYDHNKKTDNQIATVGNSTGPINPCTPRNPSLTYFNNKIYMAFKGGRTSGDTSDQDIYLMTMTADSTGPTWQNASVILNGTQTRYAPALSVCNNKLICIFSIVGSEHHDDDNDINYLYYSESSDGTNWSTPVKISDDPLYNNKATDPFAIALDNNTLAVSYVTASLNSHGEPKDDITCKLNLYNLS